MSAKRWCCMGFEGHFQMAGSRGFGIFTASALDAGPVFILQHRTVDRGVPYPQSEQPLSVVSDVQIQFCPWCGVRLHKYYRNRLRALDRSDLSISLGSD